MDTKNLTLNDIIKYCQEHNEVAWLKATAAKEVPYKVYPRIKVDGKMVVDKSQEPKVEMRPISFIQLKTEFLTHFKLAAPAQPKKPTMYDIIANL